MEQEFRPMNEVKEPQRPTFLKVLCILSFISIGFSGIVSIFSTLGGPQSEESILETRAELYESTEEMRSNGVGDLADLFEQIQRMNESLNDHFYAASAVSFLVLVVGFFGVLYMWKGRRLGFHLYILYNLVSIANIYLFVSPADIPTFAVIWGLFISAVFIFMYSRNLAWMNK
jgi:hypothetical protein